MTSECLTELTSNRPQPPGPTGLKWSKFLTGRFFVANFFKKPSAKRSRIGGAILSRFTQTHQVSLAHYPISTFGNEIEQASSEVGAQMEKWYAA